MHPSKVKTIFVCQNCGKTHSKWVGKCEECQGWGCVSEEQQSYRKKKPKSSLEILDLSHSTQSVNRMPSGIEEFDHVCGGGLVAGTILLIGGEPGIGKSTLIMQVMEKLSKALQVLYVSGEESLNQIKERASRLNINPENIKVAQINSVETILDACVINPQIKVLVVDSIQTLFSEAMESPPGTIGQIRECTMKLMQAAKEKDLTIILIGHINKEGLIAGPKVLEHMVDTVIYFEGDKGSHFRVLRAVKNRYGPCHEIGIFEMTRQGLQEVDSPSSIFLSQNYHQNTGSAILASIEGTRPLFVEIQTLITPCLYGMPRRSVVGWDAGRLNTLLAVLEARCGISFAQKDVYLSIVGGLKINEPGADLAAAASLISSINRKPLREKSIFFGEVGLSGEIRRVKAADARIKEAVKMGFSAAFAPKDASDKEGEKANKTAIEKIFYIQHLHNLVSLCSYKEE